MFYLINLVIVNSYSLYFISNILYNFKFFRVIGELVFNYYGVNIFNFLSVIF